MEPLMHAGGHDGQRLADDPGTDCVEALRVARRRLLQGFAASTVAFSLPALSARAADQRGSERPRSLITLWMAGGPSQLETWDPHPGGSIGGPTQSIATSVPGLQIAAGLPQMAERMDRVSLIRSLVSKEGDHERGTYFVKTGYRPDPTVQHPAIGAVIPMQLDGEPIRESLRMPSYVSIGSDQWPGRGGYLGEKFDAFRMPSPGAGVNNLRAAVEGSRHERRLTGLDVVSSTFRQGRRGHAAAARHDETIADAVSLMASEHLTAFEIDQEPESVRSRYGESDFGRGCLVARRLIEAGVRSVEVTLSGFDSHAANFAIHDRLVGILDPAMAALLDDLRERDLEASTVVLCIGEFGRTPHINPLDGRDHWPTGFSAVVSGGGMAAGRVIGETDPEGNQRCVDPVPVQNLYATILDRFGIDAARELMTPVGRPLKICEGTPLDVLVG
jgi:uncharacterized protein (DUF1501 family)